jgi:Glycosyltransferase family 87
VTDSGLPRPYGEGVAWRSGRLLGFLGVALYAAIALGFIARSVFGALTMPANSDWVAFAVGAHLLRSGGCLYCVGSQIATTHAMGLAPGDGINPFVNLPPVALIFEPLGLLAPLQGIGVSLAVCGAMCAAAVAMSWRLLPSGWSPAHRLGGALVSAGSLVGLVGFLQWQWVMLLALLITLILFRRRHWIAAGIVLSLLLVEPQVIWLALPMLVAARQWRVLLGFIAGAIGWLAASLVLVGPAQLARWPGFLIETHVGDAFRGVGLPAFAASITNSGSVAFWISAALGTAACALAYVLRHTLRDRPSHALALGVVLSMIAAPHIYAQDLTLLAMPCIVVANRRGDAALLVMLALSAVTAIGFLEAPGMLRLLPEIGLVMAAIVLDDVRAPLDGRGRERVTLRVPLTGPPVALG